MKLLFIFHDMPDYYGGPIVNARRLLPELVARGHDVRCLIFYVHDDAPSARYLSDNGVECCLHPLNEPTETKIKWILDQVVAIAPDVFIPNLSVPGWFAARWVRESGIPTIACHRSDDNFHWAMVDEFVLGEKEWAVSGLACVSADLCRRVREREPRHTKLCVIPSGVTVPVNSIEQESPLKLVYVGRLVNEQKRVHALIDAFAMVMHEFPEMSATLYGEGPERLNIIRRVKEHGLDRRINVAGTRPSEEIQSHLSQHNVLVLLSDYEGTPGAVMDAMACGLIPVCLNIPGGVQDLVRNRQTGLLVDDRKESFLDAIRLLADDIDLRRQMSRNARQLIMEEFSVEHAATLWEEYCAGLMGESGMRRPVALPKKFILPPVNSGLAREDQRFESSPVRITKKVVTLLKKRLS